MKKRLFAMLIMLLVLAAAACSCAKKKPVATEPTEDAKDSENAAGTEKLPDVIFPEKQFYAHLSGAATEEDPVLSMRYFYRGKRPQISQVRLDDPKADAACTGVVQNKPECPEHRGFFYDELQLSFDFSKLEYGETVTVNSVTFTVNGEDLTVDTSGRLLLSRLTGEEVRDFGSLQSCPDWDNETIETGLLQNAEKAFAFLAQKDVVIEKLEISDWYEIEKAEVYWHGDFMYLGSMEELFPMQLSPGIGVEIRVRLRAKTGTPFSAYSTDLRLYYKTADGKECVLFQPLKSKTPKNYGVSDEAAMWMDTYIAPSDEAYANTYFLEDEVFQEFVLEDNAYALKDGFYQKVEAGDPYTEQTYIVSEVTEIKMYFLYRGNLPYISFDGTNNGLSRKEDTLAVSLVFKEEYQGYKLGALTLSMDFSKLQPGTDLEISQIHLSINGIGKTLDTAGRLRYHKVPDGTFYGKDRMVADEWMLNGAETKRNNIEFALWKPSETLMIKKLEFYGPLSPQNIWVKLDGKNVGMMEDVFPLTVGQEQDVSIVADFEEEAAATYSMFGFHVLLYMETETGKEMIIRKPVRIDEVSAQLGTPKQVEKFIGYILKKKGAIT